AKARYAGKTLNRAVTRAPALAEETSPFSDPTGDVQLWPLKGQAPMGMSRKHWPSIRAINPLGPVKDSTTNVAELRKGGDKLATSSCGTVADRNRARTCEGVRRISY